MTTIINKSLKIYCNWFSVLKVADVPELCEGVADQEPKEETAS